MFSFKKRGFWSRNDVLTKFYFMRILEDIWFNLVQKLSETEIAQFSKVARIVLLANGRKKIARGEKILNLSFFIL